MSEFKGTKGKWMVVDATPVDSKNLQINTECLISVIDTNLETIAICGRKEPEQLANAKLIAAAPEMLDLLERILKGKFIVTEIEQLIKKTTE